MEADARKVPLGLRGLPETVEALDRMVDELCTRLAAAGGRPMGGDRLAFALGLPGPGARGVRLLVAYARTRHRRHEILGVPGDGYYWAPSMDEKAIQRVAALGRRMGRCWFFIASLVARKGPAVAAVQMLFDFMEPRPAGGADDLATLVVAHGASMRDVLDGITARLAGTPEGKAALADFGRTHAALLLPPEALDEFATTVTGAVGKLRGLARTG